MPNRFRNNVLILVAAHAFTGCSAPPPSSGTADRISTKYDKTTGKLQRLEYDKNGDGKPDTWADMDGTRIVKAEADENNDGQVDRWEFYAPGVPSQPSLPTLERIERATKHDGKVSRWDFFENGSLARVEEDTNGDGKVDKWETYVNRSLTMLALDTKGRGRPDRRLIYRADGSLDHIETDPTGSGTFAPLKP